MTNEWPTVPLKGLVTTPITYGVVKPGDSDVNGVALVRGTDIRDGRVLVGQLRTITASISETYRRTLLSGGEVLISLVGNPGQVAVAPPSLKGANIARQVGLMRLGDALDPRFLVAYLQSPLGKSKLAALTYGSVQQVINLGHLKEMLVPVPPFDEQRRIAGVLGALDNLIEVNRRLVADLDSVFHLEWAKRFADPTARPQIQLSEMCSTQYGYTDAATSDPTGPKFLRVADINKRNWIEWDSVPHCSVDARKDQKYRLRKGDLVVARMADPGKSARIESNLDAVFASYLVRLTPADPAWGLFLYGYLKSAQYAEYSKSAMTGSVQKNMNAKVITAARLSLPSQPEVASFNVFGEPVRAAMTDLLNEITELERTRDELLPLLMSGRVRVSEVVAA